MSHDFGTWLTPHLEIMWVHHFILCFLGQLVGELGEVTSTIPTRYLLKWEPPACNCKRVWLTWTSIIHEAGSMAKCLSLAPCGPCLVSVTPTFHPTNSPAWLHLQPDSHYSHYHSWLFPDTLGSGPGACWLFFWNGFSHSIPSLLYTTQERYLTPYTAPSLSSCFLELTFVPLSQPLLHPGYLLL